MGSKFICHFIKTAPKNLSFNFFSWHGLEQFMCLFVVSLFFSTMRIDTTQTWFFFVGGLWEQIPPFEVILRLCCSLLFLLFSDSIIDNIYGIAHL